MKSALFFLTTLFLSAAASAQMAMGSFAQDFLEANQLMEEKNWRMSLDKWLELYNQQPENANLNYKIGYCFLQLPNQKLEGMSYLETAAENTTKKYDPYDPTVDEAPLEAHFYLGLAHHLKYEMDIAIGKFEFLVDELPQKHQLHQRSLRQIEMCNEAKDQIANPKNYVITNVGSVVNINTNEYSPVLSLDESTLFFTSRRLRSDSSNVDFIEIDTGELREDIYQSFRGPDGNWSEPELLNINRDNHTASVSVSPDGQTLFIYMDEDGNGQLYQSRLIGETWNEPELLGSDINTEAWETHASMTADGKTLYFVSDREGGYGGRDIYRCVKLPNDEWSKALNIGPTINTQYEEDAVFLAPDGQTMYFASTGHASMGGFDIFYSTLGPDGQWSKPQNIGYPLNTVDDDIFFYPTATANRAYYASRKEEGYGLKDIYVIDMPDAPVEAEMAVLKGYIIATEGEELPGDTEVIVTNITTGEVMNYRPRSRDGAYVAVLEPCNQYNVVYFANGEEVHAEDMSVPCESSFSEIEKEIFLLPVELADGTSEDPGDVDAQGDGGALGDGGDPVIVDIDEPAFNPDEPINVIVADGQAYYERYFVYDSGEYDNGERNFLAFLEAVVNMHETGKGKVMIEVESSASTVPSSRFNDNEELTAHRNAQATGRIEVELKKRGLTRGEAYDFTAPKELVQGPEYGYDAWKKAKYEPFQYIKARARFAN